MSQAATTWQDLESTKGEQTGWYARRVRTVGSAGVLLAIRLPDQTPAMLLEVSAMNVPPISDYPASQGFYVYPEAMLPGPKGRVRLCLVLTSEQWRNVFAVLVDDVLNELSRCESDGSIVRELLTRLRVWQVFMRRHGPSELTVESQIGLVGELFLLRDTILGKQPAQTAIAGWVGPADAAQDFLLPGVAIELKSSTVSHTDEVHISSLDQLDAEAIPMALVLCCMLLWAADPNGSTLPELANDLRVRISEENSAARSLLDARLFEAGYLDAQADLYRHRKYSVREISFYLVSGDFPRLTRREVRAGVIACSYDIRLSDSESFKLSLAEVDDLVSRGAQ
jgi:hypothetical protein